MPKKKLLILLGAGSSASQGMPSVPDLGREMTTWAADLITGQPITYTADAIINRPTAGRPNNFELARNNREDYFAGAPGLIAEIGAPNYERILGDLHGFMNGFIKKPFGDPLLQWLQRASVLQGLNLDFEDNHLHYEVGDQIKALCKHLAHYMRQRCVAFEANAPTHFAPYRTLLNGLRDSFDLGVYTLNYDTTALTALPKSFVGFDTSVANGRFLPKEVHSRPDWGFIYHLHGSVHHNAEPIAQRPSNRRTIGDIVWQNDLSACADDRGDLRTATDHRRMVPTTLIAGGWKSDQIQEDPFLTFYTTLSKHAHEADAILIGGYGFGDDHINSVVSTVLRSRPKAPPVLVLGHTSTPRDLIRTLIGPSSPGWANAGWGPHFEIPDLPVNPVLAWRGGFHESSSELPRISRWLNTGQI